MTKQSKINLWFVLPMLVITVLGILTILESSSSASPSGSFYDVLAEDDTVRIIRIRATGECFVTTWNGGGVAPAACPR